MNELTNLKVKSVVILHENGMAVKDIASLLEVSTTRVYQLLKKDKRRKANQARKEEIRKKRTNNIADLTA